MEWRDQGTVLSVRKHGETSVILEAFTELHGRHAGVVRGGISRKMAPHLQPGTQVSLTWKARLEDHLGSFTIEPIRSRATVMNDPMALAGLNAMSAMLTSVLPEREAHGYLYAESQSLLDRLGTVPRHVAGVERGGNPRANEDRAIREIVEERRARAQGLDAL